MYRKTVFAARVLLIVVCLAGLSSIADAQDARTFRAGAATSNITPRLGVSVAGHMRDRVIDHVHDELHARCLVLDDGATQLALVMVDSCMIPRSLFNNAKQLASDRTGIPTANMLMAATHTHSAPCATPVFQSDPDPDYQKFLTRRIADGVIRAHNNLAPASIAWGAASVPDEVFNRRWKMKPGTVGNNPFGSDSDRARMNPPRAHVNLVEPWGPTDPEVSIVAIEHLDGTPMALLANYALHYVGGVPGSQASADYFGVFANRIEALLNASPQDPPFVAMMSNGTSGDINNIDFRSPAQPAEPYETMNAVAEKVAQAVQGAYKDLSFTTDIILDAVEAEIELGVRLPSEEDVATARQTIAAVQTSDMRTLPEIYARETVLLSDYPAAVTIPIQALRIGDLTIGAIPCEVFVEIGLGFKNTNPFADSFIIELANGYYGYLPTPDQHALGGYETWRARSSFLEVQASDKISESLSGLVQELYERRE